MKLHSSVIRNSFFKIIENIVVLFIRLCGRKTQSDVKIDTELVKNILFVRIDRIGDMLLTTPAIRAVKEKFRNANIYILCTPYNKDVILNNKNISGIFIYDKNPFSHFKLIRKIKKYKFDIAIDSYFGFNIKSAFLTYLSNAKIRLGYSSKNADYFFTRIVKTDVNIYESLKHLNLVKGIGVDNNDIQFDLVCDKKDSEKADKFLSGINPEKKFIIGINPGARRSTHLWQPEKYAELVGLLKKKYKAEIVITWGPKELKLAEEIKNKMAENVNIAYKTNILELTALISKFSLFISSDTGPFHIAVSQNIPILVLFGRGDCRRWAPANNKNVRIIKGKKLKDISVEEVLKEVDNIIQI